MADNKLIELIKKINYDQTNKIGLVRNILGSSPSLAEEEGIVRTCEWRIYYVEDLTQLSPDDIISKIKTTDIYSLPIAVGINGVTEITQQRSGTYLFSTVLDMPDAFGVSIEIISKGTQISVYSDETLVRRSSDRLIVTINLAKGTTPLNIVITGQASSTRIVLPPDIRAFISQYIPPTPIWRAVYPIVTNYVDPKTGSTGNALFWYNNAKAGGWGAYKLNQSSLGMIKSAEVREDGAYYLTVSGTINVLPSTLIAINSGSGANVILGYAANIVFLDSAQTSVLKVFSRDYYSTTNMVSGTLYKYAFTHLGEIVRSNADTEINYVDTNVQAGETYTYCLDAFAPFDSSLRSSKSDFQTVVAGDITPPGPIILYSFVVANNIAAVRYHTPSDADYLGTHIYYNNISSGTVDSLLLDFGLPNKDDSLQFKTVNSGTYYFRTFDQVSNEQTIGSGISFVWNGSQTTAGSNIPPTVTIRLLSSSETITDGFNPALVARFEISATDPDSGPSAIILDYKSSGGTWQTAPSNPYKINISRYYRDNWIQVRAYDGEDYSDIMTVAADYDSNPEISSAFGKIDIQTNLLQMYGAVDDDTRSLIWQSRQTIFSGTLIDSGIFTDLTSTKSFSFTTSIPDGSRRVMVLKPYSDLNGSGLLGLENRLTFDVGPRTLPSTADRTVGGAVTHTDTTVCLTVIPTTATTYYRTYPIDYGTVTSGTNNSLRDSTKANLWSDNQFNTYYEVYINSGTGSGQNRTILDTIGVSGTVTVSPNWSIIPNLTSGYEIRELFRTYNFPIIITKDPFKDTTIEYYSTINIGYGITLTESQKSLLLDSDTIPEILSGTVTEEAPKVFKVSILAMDEDVKLWELYSRKTVGNPNNCWPTANGAQNATVSQDYLRFSGNPTTTSVQFNVESGTWKFIIVPYDSFYSSGPYYYLSRTLISSGSSNPNPSIIFVDVEPHDNTPTDEYNRIYWEHNSVAENNANATVTIWAYRSDAPESNEQLVVGRRCDYDSETGNSYLNTDDSNSISLHGSVVHWVDRRSHIDGQWLTWYYQIYLYNGAAQVGKYNAQHSDWYGYL